MVDYIEANWLFYCLGVLLAIPLWLSFTTVPQASMAVLTVFGKYRRTLASGLSFKKPWEKVYDILSLQNRALKLEFKAITIDQANIGFATMVMYSVAGEDAVKAASFSFEYYSELELALQRTVESSIRQFVATTKQSEILGMRQEIVSHTKNNLDETILKWGYAVHDIQITDMSFDSAITDSMARVVASKNLLAAASNEGAALLVQRTKAAEAEAAFVTIGAAAQKEADGLKGEGLALFRQNVAEGIEHSAAKLAEAGIDANSFLLFLEYTDALKYVASHSQGKIVFMDGGAGASQRIVQGLAGLGNTP